MTVVSHDFEYSGIILDVIETLVHLDKYILQIWVDSTEIPFTVYDCDKIEFLQESIKITGSDNTITWILYGIVMCMKVTSNATP